MTEQEEEKQRLANSRLIATAGTVLAIVVALVGVAQIINGKSTEGLPPILWFALAFAIGAGARVLSQRMR